MNGIEVTGARTDNSQIFILGTNDYRAQTSVTEFTGAYVLSPFHFEKIEPFLLAGGGALRFYPSNQYINGNASPFAATQQTSMAFLYGGGVDYRVWKRIGLRLQYRGLIYKEPNFHVTQFFTGVKGHMAEPFDRSIDILVSRLRRKLGDSSSAAKIIVTVRGGGYMFSPDVRPL